MARRNDFLTHFTFDLSSTEGGKHVFRIISHKTTRRPLIDIRYFRLNWKNDFVPTTKGVCLKIDEYTALITAIRMGSDFQKVTEFRDISFLKKDDYYLLSNTTRFEDTDRKTGITLTSEDINVLSKNTFIKNEVETYSRVEHSGNM